ncbi:hypothetical protein ATW55_01445 [Ferroacidibacillus organovorans]|uniref:Major facilitator superfamily (MFS) profile domain-containing protein n=2 Tax=Ferroacidibacillus organovorans TaxID=1765683 RepID=A0A117SXX9_9BACL|nr:hypothetical protein ATW55_01445 [Ferroacidibacillus organovorans]
MRSGFFFEHPQSKDTGVLMMRCLFLRFDPPFICMNLATLCRVEKVCSMDARKRWIAFSAVTGSTFMVNLDSSIVNVALPTLSREFHLSVGALQWTVSLYLLVITAFLPVASKLADALGRRRVFVTGLIIFVASSILCGLSHQFFMLVFARGLQGLGGAIMQASVMAIVTLMFPAELRGRALGVIGSIVAGGTLMGPILGGLLIAAFGWPSIFFVNVPVGLWAIFGTLRFVPAFPGKPLSHAFDWFGGALFAVFTVSFLTLLANLSGVPEMGRELSLAMVALLSLVFFIRWELTRPEPLINLLVFKNRLFSVAMGAGLIYWILMLFPSYLFPIYLGHVLHMHAFQIGLMMMPLSVSMLVVSPLGGYLSDRVGSFKPALFGMLFFLAADALCATFQASTPIFLVALALALQGFAAGLFSSPNNTEIFSHSDPSHVGIISGLIASERNFGRSLGVTLSSFALSLGISMAGDSHASDEIALVPLSVFSRGFSLAWGIATLFCVLNLVLVILPFTAQKKRGRAAKAS